MDPAGEHDGLPEVRRAKFITMMRSSHDRRLQLRTAGAKAKGGMMTGIRHDIKTKSTNAHSGTERMRDRGAAGPTHTCLLGAFFTLLIAHCSLRIAHCSS